MEKYFHSNYFSLLLPCLEIFNLQFKIDHMTRRRRRRRRWWLHYNHITMMSLIFHFWNSSTTQHLGSAAVDGVSVGSCNFLLHLSSSYRKCYTAIVHTLLQTSCLPNWRWWWEWVHAGQRHRKISILWNDSDAWELQSQCIFVFAVSHHLSCTPMFWFNAIETIEMCNWIITIDSTRHTRDMP